MTAPKGGPNERSVRRTLAALRRGDRLDEVGGSVGVLALTTARMLDNVVASSTPAYAAAKVGALHLGVLMQLAKMFGPAEDDAWSAFMTLMSTPSRPEESDRDRGYVDLERRAMQIAPPKPTEPGNPDNGRPRL